MYRREKPVKEENQKPRKCHKQTPSFSSTLLDEIYRSIDSHREKPEDTYRETASLKQSAGFRAKTRATRDEEMRNVTRACLVEKWMEKEVNQKGSIARRKPLEFSEHDHLVFFGSTNSSSSDSSGALSSSDNEFSASKSKSKVSCFLVPKPIRTRRQEDCFLFDDCHNQKKKNEDDFVKSKSRAMKIYGNLKKVKQQPISPGVRLTSFISSLFNNIPNGKTKSKKEGPSSTCSFSRSCLNHYSSRDQMKEGIQRTVRFDQDSKAKRPPLPPPAHNVLNEFSVCRKVQNVDSDEEDRISDSSSDLFELDHLSMLGSSALCDDLPVYETTYFDKNRGLVR